MTYNGRRGPNVSEYIANLNAIPSPQDMHNQDNLNFEDDLALFTNTQFFDFDHQQDLDLQQTFDGAHAAGDAALDMKALDFAQGDFSFPDFGFGAPQSTFTETTGLPEPIQTQQPPFFPAASTSSIADATPTSATSQKRKASSPDEEDLEDDSRAAAEEDKRRRNTAASARFRVKKKQREQALEKSAKEMSDKVAALEGRINQLETENKWLKNLVTEKTESTEDIAVLWKKYSAEKELQTGDGKTGVGTRS